MCHSKLFGFAIFNILFKIRSSQQTFIFIFMIFTHAGAASFEFAKFENVHNNDRPKKYRTLGLCLKPFGGLWGTLQGQPEWNLLGECSERFHFQLSPQARVLHVYGADDLVKALRRKPSWNRLPHWEWMPTKWDAVIVHKLDQPLHYAAWDIPSMVVLNPEVVVI